MALDLPLPRQILAHAHWTINHEKMSKSTGNVVNPNFAIERFNIDTMRFYLTIDGAQSSDSDYENSYIIERYKKGLQWGIGNLTSRLLRGKKWSVRDSIVMAAEGQLKRDKHQDLLEMIPERVKVEMEQLDPRKALNSIMEIIYQVRRAPFLFFFLFFSFSVVQLLTIILSMYADKQILPRNAAMGPCKKPQRRKPHATERCPVHDCRIAPHYRHPLATVHAAEILGVA